MRSLLLFLFPLAVSAEQFQVFAPAPTLIASGSFTKDFDPAIYGPVQRFSVFSATGDAVAHASVSDRHIEIQYTSLSRSIGQLPGLPILTIDVPRLAPAAGQPSIDAVTFLSATALGVEGANFTASTPVSIDGVPVRSVDFVNDRRLTVNLASPVELTGKQLHAGTSSYFLALPATEFVPPLAAFSAAQFTNHRFMHGQFTQLVALLNPGPTPVTAIVYTVAALSGPAAHGRVVTVEPYAAETINVSSFYDQPSFWVAASAPLRAMSYARAEAFGPNAAQTFLDGPTPAPDAPAIRLPLSSTSPVVWSWQTGTTLPASTSISIEGNVPFDVSLPSVRWLAVTSAANSFTLLPNPRSLAPGDYKTTITVTPRLPGFHIEPTNIEVALTVSTGPLISGSGSCCAFVEPVPNNPATGSWTLKLTSNGAPVAFTAAISGADWATVSPSSGTTPATLTVSAHPEGLGMAPGDYEGTLTIKGSENTLTYPVGLKVFGSPTPPPPQPLQIFVSSLSFVMEAGAAAAPSNSQIVSVSPVGATIAASPDAPWLTAVAASNAPAPASVGVNASAAGLTPGMYHGAVTITAGTLGSVNLPVTLTVVAAPAQETRIAATPAALDVTGAVNETATQTVRIESNGAPVLVNLAIPEASAAAWQPGVKIDSEYVSPLGQFLTPATLTISATAAQPGRYTASLDLDTSAGARVTIPVTYTATPSQFTPPVLANVVNAASLLPGPLVPRAAFSLFGVALGPGSQVLIDGAPAVILYSSPGQVNVLAPDTLGETATVQVELLGARSAEWTLPVAKTAPAIFTLSGSGVGPAAVLNQDNSVNGAPAAAGPGTVIQIFTNSSAPDKVKIGGLDAVLQYAGQFQVNAIVPAGVAPGDAVPISIVVGAAESQPVTTIAVH